MSVFFDHICVVLISFVSVYLTAIKYLSGQHVVLISELCYRKPLNSSRASKDTLLESPY